MFPIRFPTRFSNVSDDVSAKRFYGVCWNASGATSKLVFRSIVLRVLLDPSRVDDILQEAFAHVLASRKAFPSEADAYRYIRRVVFNTTIDYYRASKRAVDCFSTEAIFVYSEPRSSQPSPLTTLLKNEFATSRSELLEEIARALTDLPPDQTRGDPADSRPASTEAE